MNTERFEDLYQIMGISRNATIEEIKKAKRDLSKKYHPDLIKDEQLKEKYTIILAKVNNAADILLNPQTKYQYDIEWDLHKLQEEQAAQERQRQQREQEEYFYGTGRTFYDYETGRTYRTYYEREPEEQQEQTRQSTSRTRGRYEGKHTSKHKNNTTFYEDIRQSWQEVREDEKRRKTYARRVHSNINNFVNRKFGRHRNLPEEILCAISKGTLHICASTIRELSKLSYIAKDNFPKFVIRNRRTAAFIMAGVIAFSAAGMNKEDVQMTEAPTITVSDSLISGDQPTDEFNVTENATAVFQEEQAIDIVVKRYHRVVVGDTLYDLAEASGCTIEDIQRENGLTSSIIKIGEELAIPYHFSSKDIEYATNNISVPTGTSIKEVAEEYNTDTASIIRLNKEGIVQNGGYYYIVSDSIKVPSFATPSEINEAKEADRAYTYRQ